MSGDVQPRKRKDKKKRKDEQVEETVAQPQPPSTPVLPNDDINIHVHKERSLGGGVCAKCVFFLLMIVISVVIGFTITDYRGQTDVEIPEAESRFASIFEGWTETATDDDHDVVHSEEVSHEEESDENHDDSNDHEEEEEETEETEEEEEEEEEPSDEDRPSDEVEDEEEETDEVSESQQEEEEEEVEEDEESQEVTDEDESEGEEEDIPAEEESEEMQQDEAVESEDESEEIKQSEEVQEPEEDASEEKVDQEDDQDEKVEENEEENVEATAANMAAKVGVGLSLFIVAYVVLVKKWRTDKPVEEDTIKDEQVPADLARRNTFVPPPALEEVEQDIENVEEEYSDDEEEIEESDDERRAMPASKRQYEELRSTYRRTIPVESDNKKYGDSEEDEGEEIEDEQYEEDVEEEEEDEEEEEEIDEEYEDDEDEKLMKKLEARYGRLGAKSSSKYADEENDDEDEDDKNFRSWKRIKKTGSEAESESENEKSGAQTIYEFQNITNAEDYVYKEDLDEAQRHLSNNIQVGLSIFIKFLENHPNSPRALYGKAEALDLLADKKRSNEILQESIQSYLDVISAQNVPTVLFLKAAERCINRMRFIGNYGRAISVHKKLIQRFPNESKYKSDLAVTYLTINRISEARSLLIDILNEFPNDGFALVHYGFILKTVDNDLKKAVDYLKRGIETREPGVIDGRFYFHLGDALARLGKNDEAMQVYEDGVLNKVFLSKYQRSLYNVDRLTGRAWWTKEQTPYNRLYEQLERNYHRIKEEGLAVLNQKGFFKDESENLRDVGDWKQFELYARGVKHVENCKKCPLTCKIVDSEPDVKSCRRGQVKFSVMHPGTHVWPHCGPTNCRLRIHLGLKVPPKTYIRVGEETRTWEEGKIFIFDDSFEHEVWHNGTEFRLVLIIDVWHPELTKNEKYNLSAI